MVACSGTATAATLITGAQIKNNSVTTKDVKNRSLRAGDFRRGSLPRGPAGPTGVSGPQGPPGLQGAAGAQGASGLSELQSVTASSPSNSESAKGPAISCPAGKRVISTDYAIVGGTTGLGGSVETDVVVTLVGSSGSLAFVDAIEEEATSANWSVSITALCARVAP